MTTVTKDNIAGIYRVGTDADTPQAEFRRTEDGVAISSGDGNPVELTASEWKDLVNTMGYHGGPNNKPT